MAAADITADAWHHVTQYGARVVDITGEPLLAVAEAILAEEQREAERDDIGAGEEYAAAWAGARVVPVYGGPDSDGEQVLAEAVLLLADGSRLRLHALPDGTASGAWAVDDGPYDGPAVAEAFADAEEALLRDLDEAAFGAVGVRGGWRTDADEERALAALANAAEAWARWQWVDGEAVTPAAAAREAAHRVGAAVVAATERVR